MIQSLLLGAFLMGQGSPPAIDPQHQADLDHDIEVGRKAAVEADRIYKLSANADYIERVNRIGGELGQIARVTQVEASWGDKRLNPFNYTFRVVKDDEVNAFSLPGGRIYVFEGLLKYVESDDELAGVLAHEIAHAAFRHIDSLQHEQSKIDALTIPLILISILKGGENAGGGILMGSLLNTALGNGWSVKAEKAADYGGLQYLLKTKYNPTAMLTMMERLAKEERNSPGRYQGIFRTHPPSRERAMAIIGQLSKRHIQLQRSAVTTSLRVTSKEGSLFFGKLPLITLGGSDAAARAQDLVPRLNRMFDAAPGMYELTRSGPDILFRNRLLLSVNEADAKAQGQSLDAAGEKAVQAFHAALFSLNFNIWDDQS